MTQAARILAEEILPAVAKVAKEAITANLVQRGQRYNGALMAIGRAGNGRDVEIFPADLQQFERRVALAEQLTSKSQSCVRFGPVADISAQSIRFL